jgi:hypothetical protein
MLCDPLLAAFYLGWLIQGHFLQRQFEYHLVPAILLAVVILMGIARLWPLLAAGFFLWTILEHPLLTRDHLALWRRCWQEGSSPVVRNHLNRTRDLSAPDWVELQRVADYLQSREVKNGEVLCYSLSSLPLYMGLDIEPPNRFILLYSAIEYFPAHLGEITRAVAEGPERFVVSDSRLLSSAHLIPLRKRTNGRLPQPADFAGRPSQCFPWTELIVYEAGRYWVHETNRQSLGRPVQLW